MLCLYFAQGAFANAEVYLTKEQALKLVLGADCQVRYEPRALSAELRERIDELGLLGENEKQAHFFSCSRDGKVSGYALIDSEVGKHLPITYIVGISPAGKATRVEVMVYREEIGWEVRDRDFLKQFEDKSLLDNLKLGQSVRHISGATISSRSLTVGVKRALFLWETFYGSNQELSKHAASGSPGF